MPLALFVQKRLFSVVWVAKQVQISTESRIMVHRPLQGELVVERARSLLCSDSYYAARESLRRHCRGGHPASMGGLVTWF